MGELSQLIKQRGNIKARLTLFQKYLAPLMDSKETSTLRINELSLRLNKMRDLSANFEEVQLQIEMLDEDSDKQLHEREVTENLFFSLIAQAQSLLDFLENSNKSETSSNNSKGGRHLKLPPLKIPPFNGDPNKWLTFRDSYLSLIHNNEDIDDISKFHYLKSYLEGAATSVIQSVSVSANNYSIAWKLLCERYNNKRLLINEHLKCLFSIEPLQKETDSGIRNLIDTLSKNLSALNSLDEPTDKWDTIIIYMASMKLDSVTAGKWEEFRSSNDSPTLDEFYSFLRRQATVLETTNARKPSIFEKRHSLPKMKSFTVSCVDAPPSKRCGICKQEHRLYECNKFKSLPVDERIAKTSLLRLCTNCLRSGHQSYQCRLGGCRICLRKHNTLLHKPHVQQTPSQNNTQSVHTTPSTAHSKTNSNENSPNSNHDSTASSPSTVVSMTAASNNQALLSTALVKVTHKGKTVKMRALLDCGSQSSFISDRAQRKIGSHRTRDHHRNVSGLGNTILHITEHCTVQLHSLNTTFSAAIKCFVIPQITDNLPHATVHTKDLGIPDNIHLADPMFYQPAEIDILLGADIFWDLIGTGRISLGPQRPVLQETHLGWIVAGPTGGKYYYNDNSKLNCHFSRDISKQLAKFWELEEIPSHSNHTHDNHCERLFTQTTHREDDGRFCVQIPLKESTEVLGESYNIAEKRFLQLERNLKKKPEVQELYRNFIHEYVLLGHMTEIPKPPFGCYLPHHAVTRESSESTKLRVVFDASAKTTSGISFNDIQHIGPVVQDDLFSILLRYRQHKYVVSADVEKMYRQILVHPSQRVLQLILWRDEPSQPLKIFQLNTVTYGTASAPFLSTRCLLQLSKDCNDKVISQSIKEDFYVDDYLSGASSEAELRHKIESVTSILDTARLPLRKFRTNVPSIFDNDSNTLLPKNLDLSSQSSVLGLKWDPPKDILWFPVSIQLDERVTKRTILSNSAKLFDPLGLLGPCTIIPKILLQKLWLTKLDWDDPVSHVVRKEWLDFVNNLNAISKIEIPRCVIISEPEVIELHSFSDASQTAYASAVYLRSIDGAGQVLIRLLCAKTKVAPVKSTTIPRLELCGALLSARLSTKVLTALRCKVHNVFHWTDSTVVLCWLSSQANDLKPFVANRVGEVQELTASASWRHVPGTQNPADLASRGLNPRLIKSSTLWWEGPQFLRKNPCDWPQMGTFKSMPNEDVPERKSYSRLHTTNSLHTTNRTHIPSTPDLSRLVNFERLSRFTTLHRSIAYVLRFVNNLRNHPKTTGPLTQNELKSSLNTLIKLHQKECFSSEIKLLNSKQNLPSNSHVLSLSPFIDENGILCVGGRIQNSNVTYERKHPILLDSSHNFTKLLFAHRHNQLLHCGPQLLLSDLRNNYWPLRGRVLARSTVNNCRLCKLMKAKGFNPIMGNLPASRVSPSLPFQTSGVDFAGPFLITDRKGRGCKITKCYLCLFICFATKALHLEVASDLSTDVFVLCLRRFISRRGKPLELYCDNGTNFVGANNEITAFLRSSNDSISGFAADEGIKFWFSPAYSPHFGGLWEAGVKSAKFHITRILGDKHLTFEELSTIFTQIEAILNSRPLTPLSSDPNDLNPLTPAHFLIGRPLTSLPSENLLDANPSRLDRYRLLETMRQHFWERWRNEYLSELQQKTKWRVKQQGLQEGELVVIKEANVPPLKWRMARIHKLYPGSDGIARVADVYTAKGMIRRGVHNLCSLPDSSSQETSRRSGAFEGGEDVRNITTS